MSFLFLALLLQDAPPTPRDPYLQNVTATSVVVCWRTKEEIEGAVEFGEKPSLGRAAKGQKGRIHAVEIRDLKPGTVYHFRVGTITGRFRTAPEGDAALRFVLYGDGRSGHAIHAKIAEAIAKETPDLVLHSGDLVENGLSSGQWENFFKTASPFLRTAPFYSALGNHERNSPAYFDNFVLPGNERWYSFDYGAAHFVVLDSNSGWRSNEQQLEWLRKDLAGAGPRWRFAVFHHPMYSTSKVEGRVKDTAAMAKLWGPIFEQGKLTAALGGHNHNYQRAEKNGVTYLTSGGGGAPLYPLGPELPETKFQQAAYHYVRFTVESKRAVAEAVDLEGKVLDRFTLSR